MTGKFPFRDLFKVLFYALIVSLFFTLGSDEEEQILARMEAGAVLIGYTCIVCRDEIRLLRGRRLFWLALFLLAFELLRFIVSPANSYYFASLRHWFIFWGLLVAGFFVVRSKDEGRGLLSVLAWSGFILALVALPALLIAGKPGYPIGAERRAFFPPEFYFSEVIGKYLLGTFAHVNWTGDVIALAFFPALALFLHGVLRAGEKGAHRSGRVGRALSSVLTPAIFLGVMAAAILGFRSRGTILCFSGALLAFLVVVFFKIRSRMTGFALGGAVLLVALFSFWGADLKGTWSELATVAGEVDRTKTSSLSANREGMKRAWAIYRSHPVWGVGKYGYSMFSEAAASPGAEDFVMLRAKALNHYFQVLAEEGVGAFFYFLFLLAWFGESVRGLFRLKSRFQFLSGLALLAGVSSVLGHAFINQLMDQFSIAMLVASLMGASLRIASCDFEDK